MKYVSLCFREEIFHGYSGVWGWGFPPRRQEMPNRFRHVVLSQLQAVSQCDNTCQEPIIIPHLHRPRGKHLFVCVCMCACVFSDYMFVACSGFFILSLPDRYWKLASLIKPYSYNLLIEAVRHLERSGALHLPHPLQRNNVQLELGDQIKP
jgi:hypothetical protein